ncbi:four-helix bundle copper-binding protein [Nitrospira sp. KM1]|uniref:four-helix bundle copper-binding protein n=1 Tax=Nitrospira sp. KM1 TaxID=1936990 RepID=UPI0018D8474E
MAHANKMSEHYKKCIAACEDCARICNTCSDDMIGMEHHGDHQLMARCIRLCRECAEICSLSGAWMSRLSPLADSLCRLCAEICDKCADTCEQHAPHHPLCGPCAEECRRCAHECRDMVEVGSR